MLHLFLAVVLTQAAVLDLIEESLDQLTSFVCHERSVMYYKQKQRGVRNDTIRLGANGDEVYSDITWDGKPFESIERLPKSSWGAYGSTLAAAVRRLKVPNGAYFSTKPDGSLELRYYTSQKESGWHLYGDSDTALIAFTSTVVISADRKTLTIYNLSQNPARHVRQAEAFTEITKQRIAGQEYALPVSAWLQTTYWNNSFHRWESTFDGYRKFAVESALLPVSSP
jgi:hypothetical protein